jgi:hypothetical protein
MSSPLEQFIRDHREEFDGEEPSSRIWDKIRLQMEPGTSQASPLRKLPVFRWSAAAAAIILIAAGSWFILGSKTNNPGTVARLTPAAAGKAQPTTAAAGTRTPNPESLRETSPANPTDAGLRPPVESSSDADMQNEEMYHYAKLVEIKERELKKIQKDEPLLYQQFASDVSRLDSIYRALAHQLPSNPNREELLEAMVQNLQLQMSLLNHQLDIIKQLNSTKKSVYEKALKSA